MKQSFFLFFFLVFCSCIFLFDDVHADAWNINDLTYSGTSISTAPATSPDGMWVNTDGTKLYISNFSDKKIYQFSMSSGWDISTLSYDSKSFLVSSQGTPDDVSFSADGTTMFMLSFYDRIVYQYTLSTPWDVSTASYDTVSLSLGSANHYDFHVKRDGTKLFSCNDYLNKIQQYTMSSAWDASSASAGTVYSYPNLSDGQELVFTMGDNGENMYIGTSGNQRIHWFTLSTPWDTSTASYSGSYTSISGQDASIRKVVFNPSGTMMLALGFGNDQIYSYTLSDTTAPTVSSFSPADNATGVGVTSTFVITFDEDIATSTGNIVFYKTSDDSTVETIDVASSQVTASGTTALVIDPSTTLTSETEYYILIDATAVDDLVGNSYVGITSTAAWSFTTADVVNPTVSSFSPADNATGVGVTSTFVITFDEDIATSTGNIVFYKASDDSIVETINIASSTVTASSTTALIIDPTVTLDTDTSYYITIAATAVDDTSGNSFAGITASTTWSFTTTDTIAPTISGASPSGSQSAGTSSVTLSVSTNESATCTYSQTSGTSFAAMTSFSSTGGTSHSTSVSVSSGNSYAYYVLCQDGSSNESSEATISFSVAQSGGGAAPAPAPSKGSGTTDHFVRMGEPRHIGSIPTQGTNVLTYIHTPVTFFLPRNDSESLPEEHTLEIVAFDLYTYTVTIEIRSEPKTFVMNLDDTIYIDMNNDGIVDVSVVFEDVVMNRAEFTISSLPATPIRKLQEISPPEPGFILDPISYTLSSSFFFTQNLSYGMLGQDVKELQIRLNHEGFLVADTGYGSPGNETLYFGNATKSALMTYQRLYELPAFGYFGPLTREHMNGVRTAPPIAMPQHSFLTPKATSYPFSRDLYLGIYGQDVQALQEYLNTQGYLVSEQEAGSPGRETTYFGIETKHALTQFQMDHHLPSFGYFGPITRAYIGR